MDRVKRSRIVSRILIIGVVAVMAGAALNLPLVGRSTRSIGPTGERHAITQMGEIGEFDSIHIEGNWNIEIVRGNNSVIVDEDSPRGIDVSNRGGLRLVNDRAQSADATVSIERLERLRVSGVASVTLNDIVSDELRIDIEGAANVRGEGCVIDELELRIDGAASADFSLSTIDNADVSINGAGQADLAMGGGALDGQISGIGRIRYSGEISQNGVRIDGLGSVERVE